MSKYNNIEEVPNAVKNITVYSSLWFEWLINGMIEDIEQVGFMTYRVTSLDKTITCHDNEKFADAIYETTEELIRKVQGQI